MRNLFGYLWEKRRGICLFCLCVFILLVSFFLYHLPMAAVAYPLILCLLAGLAALFFDYFKTRTKHRVLERIQDFSGGITGALPNADDQLNRDYQRIIQELYAKMREVEAGAEQKYLNMMDYYTTWAHQIKTPIAAMRLNLQSEDSPKARQLQNDLGRIEQYVDMVLAFLRLDSASTDYVIRWCDLDDIVRPAVRKFSGEFIARRLKLSYTPLHCMVLTDEKWCAFVVEQVLSNALKYTPSGCISISLEESKTLCIRDTGIGIVPEDLPRIFENGFTGFNGRTDRRASGIGLYLCRRICRALGHRIWAESQVGEGTVIRIDLMEQELQVE